MIESEQTRSSRRAMGFKRLRERWLLQHVSSRKTVAKAFVQKVALSLQVLDESLIAHKGHTDTQTGAVHVHVQLPSRQDARPEAS